MEDEPTTINVSNFPEGIRLSLPGYLYFVRQRFTFCNFYIQYLINDARQGCP